MSVNQVDALLSKLGTGKWNLLHIFSAGISSSLPVPHALASVFVIPRIPYECQMPNGAVSQMERENSTEEIKSCSYFMKFANGTYEEFQCTKWIYDNSTFTRTITTEHDIVCEKEYIRALYMSMYMIGVLVASPSVGYIADRFGRKSSFMVGLIAYVILSFVTGWLPNIPSMMAGRFLIGICHVPIVKISYILGMETCTPETRPIVGLMLYLPWTIYALVFSGVAYFIRDWRWLCTVGSIPSLLLLPALWFMDESPHWLAVRGRYSEAFKVLKKVARWNKKELPDDEEVISLLKSAHVVPKGKFDEEEKKAKEDFMMIIKRHVLDLFILFRTPRLRIVSSVMHLNFFVIDLLYYGLAFSGGNFSMDIFSYMAVLAVLEIPGRAFFYPVVRRFGRKIPLLSTFFLTGFFLILIAVIPSDMQGLVVAMAFLGRMCITASSCVNYLYSSELFPTEVRTRGINYSFMMSRVGSSIAPYLTEYLGTRYQWGPPLVFGGSAVLAGLATIALWDTSNRALPDTIEFLENEDSQYFSRRRNHKYSTGRQRMALQGDCSLTSIPEQIPLSAK